MNRLRTILMAEDDPRDVDLTLEVLAEHNLANQVVVARDGVEALDYLYRRGKWADRPSAPPAVVLLDLKMPRVDGLEVLRTIKGDAALRETPVVILTSSREAPDLAAAYRLGANAYVVKPVLFAEFVAAVRRLGVFWALLNEPPPVGTDKR